MNVEAKPWYPPQAGVALEESAHSSSPDEDGQPKRRHDPYRSQPAVEASAPFPPVAMDGVYDYSDALSPNFSQEFEGPPSYQDFVCTPVQREAPSQPYRSAQFRYATFRVPLPCDAPLVSATAPPMDVSESPQPCGVSASGSHSGSDGITTPRKAAALTAPVKQKKSPVPVAIPLPRSRRPNDVSMPIEVSVSTPTVRAPTPVTTSLDRSPGDKTIDTPSAYTVEKASTTYQEDSFLRCVTEAMKQPPTKAVTVVAARPIKSHSLPLPVDEAPTDGCEHLDESHAIGHATFQKDFATVSTFKVETISKERRVAHVDVTREVKVQPRKDDKHAGSKLNAFETERALEKLLSGAPESGSDPKRTTAQQNDALLEKAKASARLQEDDKKRKAQSVPQKKKENDWKVVECKSLKSVPKQVMSKHGQPKETVTRGKFDMSVLGKKATQWRDESNSDVESEAEGKAIVCAPSKTSEKKKKKKHDDPHDEDKFLEEAAKVGTVARQKHSDKVQRQYLEPLVLLQTLKLKSFPTIGSLLPPEPTTAHSQTLEAFHKVVSETHAENSHYRFNATRRCVVRIMQNHMISSCPALAAAILAEACDASTEYDVGVSNAKQAIHIARLHEIPAMEMVAHVALTRHFHKIVDTTDCRDNLARALEIALDIEEHVAIGWIAELFAVALELLGLFTESLNWHHFANRVGRECGELRLECEASAYIAIGNAAVGILDVAEEMKRTTDIKRQKLPRMEAARVVQNLAQVCMQLGDIEGAIQYHLDEREAAKAMEDSTQATHLTNSIAGARRSMGQYEQALADHHEELQYLDASPVQRDSDCLMGLALTHRDLGQYHKAREFLLKVLRSAREVGDQSVHAKSLADLGDLDAKEGLFDDALTKLAEGLRIIDHVAPNENKNYLTKVNVCEAEWKILDVLEEVHFAKGAMIEAVRFSDPMRIPNTVDAIGILQRKQRKAVPALSASAKQTSVARASQRSAALQSAEAYLHQRFFDTPVLDALMKDKVLGGVDAMIVISLRWAEATDFSVFVLTHNGERLVGNGVHLTLPPEMLQILVSGSAITAAFNGAMRDMRGNELHCDTPLFPQRHLYLQAQFKKQHPELHQRILTDKNFCLEILYDNLFRPIEKFVPPAGDGNDAPRLLFVGDGVMSLQPFAAMYDNITKSHLIERYVVSRLPSIQHALTIYAKRLASQAPTTALPPTMITCFTADDDYRRVIESAVGCPHVLSTSLDSEGAECCALSIPTSFVYDEKASLDEVARHLLKNTMVTKQRNVKLSNELYRCVHIDVERGSPVILDIPVLPDVREDFSGSLCTANGTLLAHSSDISVTWDLSPSPLVVCTRFGAYGSRATHETGVPVYRALLLAGAQRLLLPTGSSLTNIGCNSLRIVKSALESGTANVACAVRDSMNALRSEGHSVEVWASLTLFGLP